MANMLTRLVVKAIGCVGLGIGLSVVPALAQSVPAGGTRIIVPLSTGSASDTMTRVVAEKLAEAWGKPVVVENQPGANGIPATAAVVKATPDGSTLITLATNHVINASLYRSLPYDTLRDITPIVRIGFTPLVLCVTPSLPAKSIKEFMALAKSRPGQINYGSAGNGSTTHLAGEMLKSMAGIDIKHVPYKAVSQAQTDLVGGHIEAMFVVPSVAIQQVRAGRLRAIGVGSLKRLPQLPEVPTIDEDGIAGYEALAWIGLAGPAQMPPDLVNRISTQVLKILADPAVRDRITKVGLEVAEMPAQQFAEYMATEQQKWAKVVKDSGARLD